MFVIKKQSMDLFKVQENSKKKILSVVKSMRFTKNKSDPCLLSKCIDDHVVTIRIFVDDCLVVGKDELIQEVVQGL
jgi:hypothetical protein